MTANQISYQIGNKEATEHARHDKAVEEISRDANEIERQKLTFQNDWKKIDQDIQREYNAAYLNYLNSSLEWKSFYENEMKQIEQKRLDNEIYYKGLMAQLEQENVRIKQEAQTEIERSNQANELLKSQQNWLTSKQQEYNNTAVLLQSTTKELELANQLLIARERNEIEQQKLLLESKAKQADVQQQQERIEQGWVDTTVGAVKGVISSVLNFFGLRSMK